MGKIKVNVGLGYGFTAGSDRLVAKTFWEYDFPVPGKSEDEKSDKPMKPPPKMRASLRPPTSSAVAVIDGPVRGDALTALGRGAAAAAD